MSDLKYYTVVTDIGLAQFVNLQVTQQPMNLTYMAVGDGNGSEVTPTGHETALKHEVYRGQINRLAKDPDDPTQFIAELIILANIGGWTIRECGILDNEGNLIYYGSLPAVIKPVLAEGAGTDYVLTMRGLISNDVNIVLKIDPTVVIATRAFVGDAIAAHDTDPAAHSSTEMPWINCGSCTRTGNSTITLSGDQRNKYPKGKRLRFNNSDAYLCRVFGDPSYSGGVTSITVWFDIASTKLPSSVTRLERSRLTPQDTADGREMSGLRDKTTIKKLLESYCCGSYSMK